MQNACRMVPRKPRVPFHVRIKREQIARRIEGEAERVAQSTGDEFPVVAIPVGANEMAEGHPGLGVKEMFVPFTRQETVLSIVTKWGVHGRAFSRQTHVVPVNAVNHPVRAKRELVASVSDATGGSAEQLHLVELVIAFGVAQTIEAFRIV